MAHALNNTHSVQDDKTGTVVPYGLWEDFTSSFDWTKGRSGMSIFRSWHGLHVSLYRKPNQPALRFRIDGELGLMSARDGMRVLWERVLGRVGWTG